MFWKRKQGIEAQLQETTAEIVTILTGKWRDFNAAMPFKDSVSLSERIEAFVTPAREAILRNFPVMKAAPNAMIWEMIFVAVIESGTHKTADVNEARAALRAKYAS